MKNFSNFAKIYDKLNYDCDYEKWSQYLLMLINSNTDKKTCLDLACGSGKHTILFKKAGLNVIGADISDEMLMQANINCKKEYQNILFIKQDISKLSIEKKFDIITCICDGYNYISNKNIGEAFQSVFNILNCGGVFAFDLSSEYKLTNILGNNLFFEDNDEITYFWQNTLNQKECTVTMELTFFTKTEKNNTYLRFDETHKQFIHKNEFIIDLLHKTGFKKIYAYNFLTTETKIKNTTDRIQYLAIK